MCTSLLRQKKRKMQGATYGNTQSMSRLFTAVNNYFPFEP